MTGGPRATGDRPARLRSAAWFDGLNVSGLLHRASLRAGTGTRVGLGGGEKPIVGLCSSWSELVHCNVHLRILGEAARQGVLDAGGIPVEFPVISLSENLMKPTTMLYRNLMAMDVEEMIRSHPLDAVILLGGCDKTIPAQLMGSISAGVPAIVLTGGPSEPGRYRGRELGVGTDLWQYTNEVRAGRMTLEEYGELETALIPGHGHCNEMGTASTVAALTEALGMSLTGTSLTSAVAERRLGHARATGCRAVEIAREGLVPSRILTAGALHNAATLLMAVGGSTNAIVHLLALAGRLGIDFPLARLGEISARTPVITNVRPSGEHLAADLDAAGGVPAVLAELSDLLELDVLTVSGRTLRDELAGHRTSNTEVIARRNTPFQPRGGIAVVTGSLAPRGAVIKRSAADPALLRHRGRALVFEGVEDVARRIDDPALDVDAESVLILRGVGPRGAPGMPEWGMVPIPEKLLRAGVRDMVRISDARMSGTAFGTIVLHVAPEAAAGGPLAIVRDGDLIVLDVDAGRLDLDLPDGELQARLAAWTPPAPVARRGYVSLYVDHVLQADEGCDFDFLRPVPGEPVETMPRGLLSGWHGGW